MSRDWVVTDGSTVEEAVQAALELLQASIDEVEVVVEEAPRDGLLGLWRWKARVRVRRIAADLQENITLGGGDQADADGGDEGASAQRAALRDEASAARPGASVQPTIALQNGQVVIVSPGNPEPDLLIYPGDRVRVWVNDHLVDSPQAVGPKDSIRAEAINDPPHSTIEVHISDDEYTASIAVFLHPGVRYRLVDAPPGRQLRLRAQAARPIPAPLPAVADLERALADEDVVQGVSSEALRRLVEQLERDPAGAGRPVPVAFGVPAKPPVDERVELGFDPAERVRIALAEHQGDLLDLFQLSSVEPGHVLVTKHPGVKGQPGWTVTGKPVPVNEPRSARLTVGPGAVWHDDGVRVLAARGGRPIKARTSIQVHPHHTVNGDAEAAEGHIRFDGDVTVTGSVGESMRVTSKGSLSVGQSVAYAAVEAEEALFIGRGIVKSRVVAGTRYSALFQLVSFLQPLAQDLDQLLTAIAERQAEPAPEGGDGPVTTGSIVKQLLDERFARTTKRVADLHRLVADSRAPAHGEVAECVNALHRVLIGLGPLSLTDTTEIEMLHGRMRAYVQDFEEQEKSAFDVVARFVDNSEVLAAGQIVLHRGGSYSRLWAGTGISVPSGVFRGQSATVHRGNIHFKEIGGRTSAPVEVAIVTDGTFRAGLVHPGVSVTIGNRRHTFRQPTRNVKLRLSDGELQIRSG